MRTVAVLLLVTACGHDHRRDRSQVSDTLDKLARTAKVAFVSTDSFPIGKVGPTPAAPCCGQPDNKCAVTRDWATEPVWRALEFRIDEPSLYQYSYESDGKTFKITATGDLDCNGTPGVWTVDGMVVDGNPRSTVTRPPNGTY